MSAKFCYLKIWRLSDDVRIWWPKWNKPSVFKRVYILCYRKIWPPSVKTSEFPGSGTAASIQCWPWPKKTSWGARHVSLELAPHSCRYWETAPLRGEPHSAHSEQTQAFPPPATQPHFCQLRCKYHLELTFTDSASPGRRIPTHPDFKGFLTNNPWNTTPYPFSIYPTNTEN